MTELDLLNDGLPDDRVLWMRPNEVPGLSKEELAARDELLARPEIVEAVVAVESSFSGEERTTRLVELNRRIREAADEASRKRSVAEFFATGRSPRAG